MANIGNKITIGKILLIEDDFVSKLIIEKFCEMKGFGLLSASDGRQGLELYENNEFDVILTDLQLPELSGFEVVDIIRDKEKLTKQHIPIIATTAFTLDESISLRQKYDIDAYISKPIDLKKLEGMINEYIRKNHI